MKNFAIISDVLPEAQWREIYDLVASPDFPWVYSEELSLDVKDNPFTQNPGIVGSCGFSHALCVEENPPEYSSYWNQVKPMLSTMVRRPDMSVLVNATTYRCKANLQTQLNNSGSDNHNMPHIDPAFFNKEGNNWIFLYYLCDSDGDTFIFNEIADDGLPEKLTLRERVTPKANTGILFRDNIFHASSNPVTSRRRLNINFNLLVNQTVACSGTN